MKNNSNGLLTRPPSLAFPFPPMESEKGKKLSLFISGKNGAGGRAARPLS